MREYWAKIIVVSTGILIMLLAYWFAKIQNPVEVSGIDNTMTEAASVAVSKGRDIYQQQNCPVCHAVAGVGNPRYPLDGIGSKFGLDEIKKRVTGVSSAQQDLSERVRVMKRNYSKIPAEDMKELLTYLRSLK